MQIINSYEFSSINFYGLYAWQETYTLLKLKEKNAGILDTLPCIINDDSYIMFRLVWMGNWIIYKEEGWNHKTQTLKFYAFHSLT